MHALSPLPSVAVLAWSAAAAAQAPHYQLPVAEIERRLETAPFEVLAIADNRWEGDRTQRSVIRFRDGTTMGVKWARASEGGSTLNNQPQYELAAYRLQKLFLDPDDRVVPPTAVRALPLDIYRQLEPGLPPTFDGTRSVLVVLQYWLDDVAPLDSIDAARLRDPVYARRLAQLNLLTHLIRHADSNHGNVLVSAAGEPRMFAVDNGVAFNSPDSPRGTYWKELRVDRLPAAAVDRLRRVTREELHSTLAVVAQFRVDDDGRLVAVRPTARLHPNRGVDRADRVVQLGLTATEIDAVFDRIQAVLRRVDAGRLTTLKDNH